MDGKFEYEGIDINLIKDEILEVAFENSYNVLIGECEIQEAELHEMNDNKVALFMYDPERSAELEDLVIMMLYFEKHEMYERCAILKEMALEIQNKE
tara:strand:- start:35 stop:325 length:291 start_codon:yes stop_codon:yes gene_type:complete